LFTGLFRPGLFTFHRCRTAEFDLHILNLLLLGFVAGGRFEVATPTEILLRKKISKIYYDTIPLKHSNG
jgi:hypothetical protein